MGGTRLGRDAVMRDYEVRFVDDEKLPAGHDWMLLRDGSCACVFVRRSVEQTCGHRCGACPILASADEAFRHLSTPLAV
jgi:hypothetical protein